MTFLKLCYYRSAHEPRALEKLTELMDSGVDVDVKATFNATALCFICLTNSSPNGVDILRLLLEVNCSFDVARSCDVPLLFHSVVRIQTFEFF